MKERIREQGKKGEEENKEEMGEQGNKESEERGE